MPYENEPTEEHRAIGRARPPQPPAEPQVEPLVEPLGESRGDALGEPLGGLPEDVEPGWDEPPMPVDAPIAQRPTTTRFDKQRNQRR
jgi:hypothetical protein